MDSLSNLVRVLAPQGTLELHCRFAGGWLVDHGPALPGHLPYHVVLEGCGRVGIGARELDLVPGDIVLFPHGAAHTVRSLGAGLRTGCIAPAPPSTPPERHFNGAVTEIFHPDAGKPQEMLDLLCGNFVLGTPGGLLLRTLPEVVCIHTAGRADCAWLHSLTSMMRAEASTALPGTAAVIGQLSTALFTVLLRALMADGGVTQGLLALLADARLSKAVDAVLAAPADSWTVATLAERCHMARATFAKRFTQISGLTPLEVVTSLRMELAGRMLVQSNATAGRVGERCGYASEAAFGRAFKLHFGTTPRAYRLAA
jgi:AraC family transcriptional activator of mtrCDE